MRHVQWSDDALDDLEWQAVAIAKDNPDAARRVARRIRATGDNLADFATGHPGRVSGTYEKSVAGLPYIIAYALSEDESVVTILHVIHTSRNWPEEEWPQ
ncbi:type II toxin-antitoxin system RelE/ParE family toxin [Sphingobium scionense]|uniref:Plasmid stabilization protein n=2 Tax=Sphingomonadaceae TaxID=41297 RepID=A0A1L4A084_9SPHN|nr:MULTISPECIES: type II toxin-antitoxin system RelE/ParE family toxin [Sphingomonadaceae]API61294.1 plasmid stabilization protein [Tardibacter chloracetimidivorans]MBB4151513.1 plasmid stabilization system protein ParE [Sphingobium scionense]